MYWLPNYTGTLECSKFAPPPMLPNQIWSEFGHLEKELEAHIWRVSRAHEYYLHAKYELLTPSLDDRTQTRSDLGAWGGAPAKFATL